MATKKPQTNTLNPEQDFSHLSLPELLLARERNHIELMRKQNVVGTAVGLYLIRDKEPWPRNGEERVHKGPKPSRTLANSHARKYSWPCVLVLVQEWKEEAALPWQDRVPPALYLDDNRKVPVCVVEAPLQDRIDTTMRSALFPVHRIGGGYPVVARVQGQEHLASIGCLVSDGHTAYALTNRHVTGEPGEPVYTQIGGTMVRIGESARAGLHLRRRLFEEVYPGWPGKNLFLNLDIGLIRIDDLNHWTAQVYGVGTIGQLADLATDNLSLRLINAHVRAYGCASGLMRGSIKALFYRYKSLGGFDYVADFLIGPTGEKDNFSTHPGDSGTLWMLEEEKGPPSPIALQWGGQEFVSDQGQSVTSFALATNLSTVASLLEVDIVRDWNLGVTEYWGEMGHYTVGGLACTVGFKGLPGLERFMQRNLDRVGFAIDDLKVKDRVLRNVAHYSFVPLADVADDIWRNTRPSDANNHFADMDQKASSGPYAGKTLLQLCTDPANVDPQVWSDFYAGSPGTNPGALPFRVWQSYEEGVKRLIDGDLAGFLTAVGTMAHYVGDACQPLHISRLHHGNPPLHPGTVPYKVHEVYETQMLNEHAPELVDGVAAYLDNKSVSPTFTGGKAAAVRVVRLMQETINALPPQDIVNAYNEEHTPASRLERLWNDFGAKTIDRIGEGCLCLAEIWASAWQQGNGESIPQTKLTPIDTDTLAALYNDSQFIPSVSLKSMVSILQSVSPDGSALLQPTPVKRRRRKR